MLINPDFILASSGTKTRYGFDRNELSFYYKTYSSYTLNHIVDKRLKILDLLKITNYSNKMDFYLPNNLDNNVLEFINKFKPHKVVALNTEGSNSSRTLTKEQIIEHIWGYEEITDSALKNLLNRLRSKIGFDIILSIKGRGWKLDTAR